MTTSEIPKKRLFKTNLSKEISIALVVKFAVIFMIWFLFFRNPVDDSLTGSEINNIIFGGSDANTPQQKIDIRNVQEK